MLLSISFLFFLLFRVVLVVCLSLLLLHFGGEEIKKKFNSICERDGEWMGLMLFCYDTSGYSATTTSSEEKRAPWLQLKCQNIFALSSHLLYFHLHSPAKTTQLFKSLFFIHLFRSVGVDL